MRDLVECGIDAQGVVQRRSGEAVASGIGATARERPGDAVAMRRGIGAGAGTGQAKRGAAPRDAEGKPRGSGEDIAVAALTTSASERPASAPVKRRGRSVTVNLAESPLGWLRSRGLIDVRQFEAGERLRCDYETAAIAPAVTMRWRSRVDGGGHGGLDPTLAQIAAKRRFDAATGAAGPGLKDVLWRVVCAGEALPAAERALGWPTRSAKLVLGLALDRLADHYGLR